MTRALAVSLCIAAAACGGSKASPTAPAASAVLQGQTTSAIDGSATGQVSIQLGAKYTLQSDTNGNFDVSVGGPDTYWTVLSAPGIVERQTSIAAPTSSRLKISLIPSTFDLQAFDQMFRTSHNRLQRWTARPSLVVIGTVMKFGSGGTDRFEATGERLSEDEVASLVSHLNEGLALLTAGTYTTFASVDIERPQAAEQVEVHRTGKIVIGRYNGIMNLEQAVGLGSWGEQSDGAVVSGTVWLDRSFDRDDPRRRLVRIHELGHALGYTHVTARTSIMNPSLGPEPTDFDRAAAAIAFQRPVGNMSPDFDPGSSARTSALAEGGVRWSRPIP